MSKYKVGNKVVLEISRHEGFYGFSDDNNTSVWIRDDHLDRCAKPLYTYTEPLEAEIRRQTAEITRLLAENKRLKAENGNVIWESEQAFDRGCNAAWKLARKLVNMSLAKMKELFGTEYLWDIYNAYTYPEAAAKFEAWKKAKEEIKDGDILEGIYDNNVKGVVINLCPDNTAYLVFDDGTTGICNIDIFKKTGRHIDIDSFLKQIGGE